MHAAFKEWAIVCEALGTGRQSVILRKGGVAEGSKGFAFRHREFLLFPTWFHEQLEKTTLPPETQVPEAPGEELEVRYTASIEWSGVLTNRDRVSRLRSLHVLREGVVEERYRYSDSEGVHVLLSASIVLIRPSGSKTRKNTAAAAHGSSFRKSKTGFWSR
jgi:Uncharacterized protein conserved in bacteria